MIRVAGVRFKAAGKVYYFDPAEMELFAGDNVIVETARGVEFGTLSADIAEVEEDEIVAPLKPILRKADENDVRRHEENLKKKDRALQLCQEKIDKHGLEMKLVDVEYTFDNSKVIFYFTADGRVDFRELVKDLAGVFKMRIELRQIGVRDETKMMGGIGSCGRELPIKISGICGRLMCCLQYENDTYCHLRKGMPDVGERITTRDGKAVVMDVNILENKIKTRLILEEKSDTKPEKLSTEYYVYGKEEIQRAPNKRNQEKNFVKKPKKNKPSAMDADLSSMSEEELMQQAELLDLE